MTHFITLTCAGMALLLLGGCAHGFSERTAPCPPSASLNDNPCQHLPINIARQNILSSNSLS
jgi:hypothetical protein